MLFSEPLRYLITKGEATPANFHRKKSEILEIIKKAAEAKIAVIQIREKHLTAKSLFHLASDAARITAETDTKLLISDRADVALAANADGVHLPADSIAAGVIRRSFPEKFIIGVSTHSLEEAETAMNQGADFVTFGPVFATPNKGEPKGLKELKIVCKRLAPFPVVALGGINEENYNLALQNGASGFAAIRYLNDIETLRKLSHH